LRFKKYNEAVEKAKNEPAIPPPSISFCQPANSAGIVQFLGWLPFIAANPGISVFRHRWPAA